LLQIILYYIRVYANITTYLLISLVYFLNITSNFPLFDLLTRVCLDDSIINMFNFFWTSIIYLVPISLTLCLLLYQFFKNTFNLPYLCLSCIITLYSIELVELILLNFNFLNLNFLGSSINTLLLNNLNKYHPYILYTSAFMLLITYSQLFNKYLQPTSYTTPYYLSYFCLLNKSTLVWNFYALLLGSWWALQEGTWGGWWNWDTSEVLGLLILLIALVNVHSRTYVYLNTFNNVRQGIYITFILIFFITLQLNFEITSHSFGSRLSYFFNNNFSLTQLLLIFISVLINLVLNISKNSKSLYNTFFTNHALKVNTFTFYLIWLFLLTWTLLLFFINMPLINYYIWQSLELNILNVTFNVSIVIVWLYFFILVSAPIKYNPLPLIQALILPLLFLPITLVTLITLIPQLNPFWLLHTLLVILIYTNYISFTYDLNILLEEYLIFNLVEFTLPTYIQTNIFSCSNMITDFNVVGYTNFNNKIKLESFIYKSNSLETNEFNLLFNNQSLFNNYLTLKVLYIEVISLEITSLEPFLVTLTLLLLIFTYTQSLYYNTISLYH
jgi:hypothetical protein